MREHAHREAATQPPSAIRRRSVRSRSTLPETALAPTEAKTMLSLQRLVGNHAAVQLKGSEGGTAKPPSVADVTGTGGRPLSPATRAAMEDAFGHDFSSVRVHTGGDAGASARSLNARAYTVGDHIVLGAGQDASSPHVLRTLAHELTHVVQQRTGPVDSVPGPGGIRVSSPVDPFEREADRTAVRVIAGMAAHPSGRTSSPRATEGDLEADGTSRTTLRRQLHATPAIRSLPLTVQRIDDGKAPFGHSQILNHPDWHKEAENFEQRLGSFCFGLPRAKAAATAALKRLEEVLLAYYTDMTREQVRKSFVKDDAKSAGQVGDTDSSDEAIRDLLEGNGNLRELMTAFYNAAYYKSGKDLDDPGITLRAILNDITNNNKSGTAHDLQLNEPALAEQAAYMSGSFRSWTSWLAGRVNPEKAYLFSADVFALGNIAAQSQNWVGDLSEITTSQMPRSSRSSEEKATGGAKKTPGEYRRMNAGLSDRELAFIEANGGPIDVSGVDIVEVPLNDVKRDPDGRPILDPIRKEPGVLTVEVHYDSTSNNLDKVLKIVSAKKTIENPRAGDLKPIDGQYPEGPELPLPWQEGAAWWKIDPKSAWYKSVHDSLGMPVVAGVSGTTARMLSAFSWLKVPSADILDFRLALLGWMLTSWDHSFYEIMRGSHLAGVKGPDESSEGQDAIQLYRRLPPLSLEELRAGAGKNRMFPDEVIYARLARTEQSMGGLALPGKPGVTKADTLSNKLKAASDSENLGPGETAKPVDASWKAYLAENQASATELWAKLSPANILALLAYTGAGHSMINMVMATSRLGGGMLDDGLQRRLFARKLRELLDGKLDATTKEPLVASLAGDSGLKALMSTYSSTTDVKVKKQLREKMYERIDVIAGAVFDEMKMHADMLVDTLKLLPAVSGTVWRGDWRPGGMGSVGGRLLGWAAGLVGTYKSDQIAIDEFASASRDQATADRFLKDYKSTSTSHPVLIQLTLSGKAGRDISIFSKFQHEKEVLLMPGSRFRITKTTETDFPGGRGELIEAVEG